VFYFIFYIDTFSICTITRYNASYELWCFILFSNSELLDGKGILHKENIELKPKFNDKMISAVVPRLPVRLPIDIIIVLLHILQSQKVFVI
jgi:hypothetical protein